jgi:DEAD/DEAH box helicase domain-containing protein
MAGETANRIRLNASYWKHPYSVPFSEDVVPSSLFLRNAHYLIMDLETQELAEDVGGWEFKDRLKVSVACAYDSATDQFLTYREHELKNLIDLCENRLVVGYNQIGFDLPILVKYGLDLKRVNAFDIMLDLQTLTRQRFLKLEHVARGTLNAGKSADGLLAVEWWKQGLVDKIIEYCLQDVKVTKEVFEFGRKNGNVTIQRSEDTKRVVPVNWN